MVKLFGAENLYRIRVGDYRIIFEPDHTARQLTIHYVGHRRDVYRSMEKTSLSTCQS
jgi:mRNA interferase RelE/StbE